MLRAREVLECLDCPQPLMDKMLESIRQYPTRYRVLALQCDSALGEEDTIGTAASLEEAFQSVLLERLFEDVPPIPFASISNGTLQTMLSGYECADDEIEVKGAYVNMADNSSNPEEATVESVPKTQKEGGGDDDKPPHKKQKLAGCDYLCASASCQQSAATIARYFFVRGKTYCGHCLDEFFLLKLRFCYEHVARDGGSGPRDFTITDQENKNRRGLTLDQCDLKDDEFWVRLFYERNAYDFGEIRFVGVIPKK